VPGPDPTHWLHRLTSEEWLRAAENELGRARAALEHKQSRAGLTGARRAAGMAWNAVLAIAPDDGYGRSYMDHLKALGDDASVPDRVRESARALLRAPLQPELVTLGRGDTHLADAAQSIVAHARERIEPSALA
jgi:HEPN domain-containing protein